MPYIIDSYFLSPELSITYVPVLKDTAGAWRQRGAPELKLVMVPKQEAALLITYYKAKMDRFTRKHLKDYVAALRV